MSAGGAATGGQVGMPAGQGATGAVAMTGGAGTNPSMAPMPQASKPAEVAGFKHDGQVGNTDIRTTAAKASSGGFSRTDIFMGAALGCTAGLILYSIFGRKRSKFVYRVDSNNY